MCDTGHWLLEDVSNASPASFPVPFPFSSPCPTQLCSIASMKTRMPSDSWGSHMGPLPNRIVLKLNCRNVLCFGC